MADALTPDLDPAAAALEPAVRQGIASANVDQTALTKEREVVKTAWKEYTQARDFDKGARAQYVVDRRYAAGTAQLNFAVSANIIGTFIDILVSFLYARNPDVSIKKSHQVDNLGTEDMDLFAETGQVIVSKQFKAPIVRLKQNARSAVRSALTVGAGWLKAFMVAEERPSPMARAKIKDLRDNIDRLEQLTLQLQTDKDELGNPLDPTQLAAKEKELREQQDALSHEIELTIRKQLVVDFVSPENIQVSLDVRSIADFQNANWVADATYAPISELEARFERLREEPYRECIAKVTKYYQRGPTRETEPLSDNVLRLGVADSSVQAERAEQYTTADSQYGGQADESGIAFAKIVERWNKVTNHVETMIDGLDYWAREPYEPAYPTTQFCPYFLVTFYEVDGERHPQSLPFRLFKLQDEFCSVRSSMRLTRQRSKPGVLFLASGVSTEDAKRLEAGTEAEYIPLNPLKKDGNINELFAAKPIPNIDIRLYDTAPILRDMERIAGIQEALQQSVSTEKTATEAEIQQTGFKSRTDADRDNVETMLTFLAQAVFEQCISALSTEDAVKMAGPKAFWPAGMDVQELLSMVEVTIEAGTTGKPRQRADMDAWGVVMPQLKELITLIAQAQLIPGNEPMVEAMKALLEETLVRMGDDTDISRFLPKPPPLLPQMGMGAPGIPPGAPTPGADPAAPPPGADPAAPPAEEPPPPPIA